MFDGDEKNCPDCRRKINEFCKRRYYENKENGRCVKCMRPTNGKTYCDKCRAVMRVKSSIHYENTREQYKESIRKMVAAGECTWCHAKNDSTKSKYYCESCRQKVNERNRKREIQKLYKEWNKNGQS